MDHSDINSNSQLLLWIQTRIKNWFKYNCASQSYIFRLTIELGIECSACSRSNALRRYFWDFMLNGVKNSTIIRSAFQCKLRFSHTSDNGSSDIYMQSGFAVYQPPSFHLNSQLSQGYVNNSRLSPWHPYHRINWGKDRIHREKLRHNPYIIRACHVCCARIR